MNFLKRITEPKIFSQKEADEMLKLQRMKFEQQYWALWSKMINKTEQITATEVEEIGKKIFKN